MNTTLVISADNHGGRPSGGTIIFCLVMVILGVIFAVTGNMLVDELSPWADDFDKFAAFAALGLGVVAILSGIAYPFILKATIGKSHMEVYEDHIEGHMAASSAGWSDVREPLSKISSVATSKASITITLTNGSILRCSAYNAAEVAEAIRARIGERP